MEDHLTSRGMQGGSRQLFCGRIVRRKRSWLVWRPLKRHLVTAAIPRGKPSLLYGLQHETWETRGSFVQQDEASYFGRRYCLVMSAKEKPEEPEQIEHSSLRVVGPISGALSVVRSNT